MSEDHISLLDIEACLKLRQVRLVFAPKVEASYERQTKRRRAAILCDTTVVSLIVYNLLLIVDYLLLTTTFLWSLVLHGLVTGLSLCAVAIVKAKPDRAIRELLAALVPVSMLGQVMTIYAVNDGVAADNYQYFAIILVLLINTTYRIYFDFAKIISGAIAGLYLSMIWLSGHSSWPTQVTGTALMLTTVGTTLWVCYLREREARYAFLKRSQDRLHHAAVEAAATRDDLTGLLNRRSLDERLARLWGSAEGRDVSAATVMIDVDCFKAFNDLYGHLAGDTCLARVAGAIVAQLPDNEDLAVRFGGEEFLVVLMRTELVDAVQVAERIRWAIEGLDIPHEASPCGVVTASFGVMAGPMSEHPASDLIAAADTALYAAKRAGRNRVWPPFVKPDSWVHAREYKPIRLAS